MVETQIASAGDYVKVGDPLFHLVSSAQAARPPALSRIGRAPPEEGPAGGPRFAAAAGQRNQRRRQRDQARRDRGRPRPRRHRRLRNQDGLRPGGTVNAAWWSPRREDAVLVPEQSVVLRPAGKVVYVIAEGKALQHVVEAGARRAGMVEIVKGLPAGATVALDGAGFLTNNAAVLSGARQAARRRASPRKVSPRNTAPPRPPPAEAKK
jgi:membrane fusion protein (multidrug efflux system)